MITFIWIIILDETIEHNRNSRAARGHGSKESTHNIFINIYPRSHQLEVIYYHNPFVTKIVSKRLISK
jgi:hypothetical protein